MAINFYLNEIQVNAETNTTLTDKIGTFDEGVLPLEISNVKNAILPMTNLRIYSTITGDNWYFVVISDDVEVVSKTKPILYKHNLVVRSKEYKLTKHILRNNEFSQPKDRENNAKINFCVFATEKATATTEFSYPPTVKGKFGYSFKNIQMNSRTKVSDAKLKISSKLWLYSSIYEGENAKTFETIESINENIHTRGQVFIRRYDNGTYHSQQIVNITNQTEINVPTGIFVNMTDKTEIRIELGTTKFRFNITGTNKGGIANINITLSLNTYFYSLLDIVKQINKQTEKYYNSHGNTPLFALTTDSDKLDVLENTIAPEISFTGVNVYQALYQLFSYIDAIPTIDKNNKLSFDYLNNNNQNALVIEKSDEKIAINDDYYTNKLVANYQNAKQENAIIIPAINKTARVSTRNYGVPGANDYVIKLPKPIDYVDRVTLELPLLGFKFISVRVVIDGVSLVYEYLAVDYIDITDQVVENSIYNILDTYGQSGNVDNFYIVQQQTNNCLTYLKGGVEIDIMGLASGYLMEKEIWKYAVVVSILFKFGLAYSIVRLPDSTYGVGFDYTSLNNINKFDIKYNVEYHAIYDGKVEQVSSTNKYEGETYVNQETSSVSLNRMGNNLQGLIAKLGNEIENISIGVSSYGSRMKAGSLWVDDDGNRYIANVVKTTFSTKSSQVIVEAEFTKNFNLLNQYTRIDQDKRFYEIATEITTKGYDNITEYLIFSYDELETSGYDSALTETALHTIIEKTLLNSGNYKTLDYATFQAYTNENDENPAYTEHIVVPMHIYGSGNSLCFEMDFNNSINAGDRLTGSSSLFTKTTLYTSENGFADRIKVIGRNATTTAYFGENYPAVPYSAVSGDAEMFDIDYKYYKKPNEIFHLNYALAFLSGNGSEFYFGNKFIEQNGIINNSKLAREIKLYRSNGLYSIIDNKILDDSIEVALEYITYNYNSTNRRLEMTISTETAFTCKSWALADENGNVLIASNKVITNNNRIIVYVIPRRNRI